MPMHQLHKLWIQFSRSHVYNFGEHVSIAEEMEKRGILPSSFMALDPPAPGAPFVWDDIARMKTLNTEQGRKGWEAHVCPLQLDIVDRLIDRYSNAGDLVLDPFGGLGTVARNAVLKGRRGYSIELNEQYWRDSVAYCRSAELKVSQPTLFDLLALTICIGALSCRLWVLHVTGNMPHDRDEGLLLANVWKLLGVLAAMLVLSSSILLLTRTAEMSGLSLTAGFSAVPRVLLKSHYGRVWLLRVSATPDRNGF